MEAFGLAAVGLKDNLRGIKDSSNDNKLALHKNRGVSGMSTLKDLEVSNPFSKEKAKWDA